MLLLWVLLSTCIVHMHVRARRRCNQRHGEYCGKLSRKGMVMVADRYSDIVIRRIVVLMAVAAEDGGQRLRKAWEYQRIPCCCCCSTRRYRGSPSSSVHALRQPRRRVLRRPKNDAHELPLRRKVQFGEYLIHCFVAEDVERDGSSGAFFHGEAVGGGGLH